MADELILIIEDNEKNRKLVRDVLQVKGYKTIESETAEEGLKLALEKSPALDPHGHPASRNGWNYGAEAAPGQPTNEKHTCHCDHGISHDQQPAGDVG